MKPIVVSEGAGRAMCKFREDKFREDRETDGSGRNKPLTTLIWCSILKTELDPFSSVCSRCILYKPTETTEGI